MIPVLPVTHMAGTTQLYLISAVIQSSIVSEFWVVMCRADRSMYHALGYATVMYLQAAMTFVQVRF